MTFSSQSVLVLAIVAITGSSSRGHAESSTGTWVAGGSLGHEIPYLLPTVGVELERVTGSGFGLALGGVYGAVGPQQGRLVVRLRSHWGAVTGGLGAGASIGRWRQGSCFSIACGGVHEQWDWSVWGRAELFLEWQTRSALRIRVQVGHELALAHGDCRLGADSDAGQPGEPCADTFEHEIADFRLNADIALGWAF